MNLRIAPRIVAFNLTVATLMAAGTASADTVFDNTSNGQTDTSTGSTPNTFMGDGYALLPGTTDITGFDLFPVNLSGTTFIGISATVYVWGSVNTGTVSASSPAFSDLLGTYTETSTAPYASGSYYELAFALTTPLAVSGADIGLTFNYKGTTDGTTYNNVNSLTSLISYGEAPTTGADLFNGYYRNANSEVNGDFTSTLRSLGQSDQSDAVIIYGTVPEPSTLALAALGGLGWFFRRRA